MKSVLHRIRSRLGMAAWLFAVWLLLWGRADALTVIGGVIVVVIAHTVSRMPSVPTITRVRPLRLAEALLEFSWDLLVSSVVIGRHALYRPGQVRGALIEVSARTRSELILLGVTMSISLRPGTILVEPDWERSVLRIHAMPIRSQAEADSARDGVLRTERRLMRAFETSEDIPAEGNR